MARFNREDYRTAIPQLEKMIDQANSKIDELKNVLGDLEAIRTELDGKQDLLESGRNIKTVNNNSLLGEGNITIQGGGGEGTSDHSQLSNRDLPNQHPISAITNLQTTLNNKSNTGHTHSQYITEEEDPTVPEWAKAESKPTYTAEEVGALPDDTPIPTVPTNVSAFTNDAGYITQNIKVINADSAVIPYATITRYVDEYDDVLLKYDGRTYRYFGIVNSYHYFTATHYTTLYYYRVSTSNSNSSGSRTVPATSSTYSATSSSAMTGIAVAQALATINVPTKTSELTNDSGFLIESDLSDVAFTGDYNDLVNQPTIPSATTVEQVLTSGTEIAKINNISLFAPQGGGGGTGEVFDGECVTLAGNAGEVTLSTSAANYLTGRSAIWGATENYTDVFDVSLNPATITAKKSGMYLVKMSAYFTTNFTANDIIHINLEKQTSGTTSWAVMGVAGYVSRVTNASWYERVDCVGYLNLNIGDSIRMTCYNQTGARGRINVGGNTNLQIMQLDAFVSSSDFPVDHGEKAVGANNAGRCVWTKWNSGKAELDYTYPSAGVTTKVWTAPIYYGDYTSWSNVFNEVCDGLFIEPPNFVNCDSNNSQFINVIPMSWDKNGVTGIRFLSVNAKTGVDCRLHIRAVGKWK